MTDAQDMPEQLSEKTPAASPLAGIRVLDFSSILSGPYCTRWLADLGADVIKVEALQGDYMRSRSPLRDGHSAYFGHLNAGKQSIALDLKNADAVAIARRLAATSDIVVESYRPGVMRRLGLDYPTLSADNIGLIYCAISGYGQSGPDAARPAFAQIVHAASGFEATNMGYQDTSDRPPNIGIFIADALTAAFAVMGIQSALIQRGATGRGQMVDVTLMESMLNLLVYEFQEAQFPSDVRRPVYRPSCASDGFIIIAAVNQNNFVNLFNAVGKPEWLNDPRFATDAARQKNWDELFALIDEWTSKRTVVACEAELTAAGVPCSAYRSVGDILTNAHFVERGSFARVADAAGSFLVPNLPFKLSEGRAEARTAVPSLGEHTDSVLSDILHMESDEIARLKAAGAIA